MRNIAKRALEKQKTPNADALKVVYWGEIEKCAKLLSYKFNAADTHKDGILSLKAFKNIIRGTKFITPKEQNLLIRLQKNDLVKISEFKDMLFNVRYEIAVSEMMDSNMSQIEYFIRGEFAKEDKDDSGFISIQAAGEALRRCKKLNLTPF